MTRPILIFSESISFCHIVRPLILARWVRRLGYPIICACSEKARPIFQREGFETTSIKVGQPEKIYRDLALGRRMHSAENLFFSDDERLIRSYKPRLIISDFRFSALQLAHALRIPSVNITSASCHPNFNRLSSLPDCLARPRFISPQLLQALYLRTPGLNKLLYQLVMKYHSAPLKRASGRAGLKPLTDFYQYAGLGDLVLISDHPDVLPLTQIRSQDMYIGALSWTRADPLPEELEQLDAEKKTVYISLGTQEALDVGFLHPLVDRLLSSGLQVIISRGGRKSLPLPTRRLGCLIFDFINEQVLLPHVDVFLYHGGAMSTYEGLASGTPMVAIPAMSDQHYHAEALVRLGIGASVRPSSLNVEQLAQLVRNFALDLNLQARAKEWGARVRSYDRRDDIIERIAAMTEGFNSLRLKQAY